MWRRLWPCRRSARSVDAQRDAQRGGREESPGEPRRDPDARKGLAHLGGEHARRRPTPRCTSHASSRSRNSSARLAPRCGSYKPKCGKQRDDRRRAPGDREQQHRVRAAATSGRYRRERGGADRQRNGGIEHAQQRGEQRCVRLEERPGHRGIMACAPCVHAMRQPTKAANAPRKRAVAKRSALRAACRRHDRRGQCLERVDRCRRLPSAVCASKNTPVASTRLRIAQRLDRAAAAHRR